jgi:FkbM family methyltransferase
MDILAMILFVGIVLVVLLLLGVSHRTRYSSKSSSEQIQHKMNQCGCGCGCGCHDNIAEVGEYKFVIKNRFDAIEGVLARGVFWNSEVIETIKSYAKTNDVLFIIGAHIGSTVVPLSKYVSVIHCFEPSIDTYNHLLENIAVNELTNVFPHNTALGRRVEQAYMFDMTNDRIKLNKGGNHVITSDDIQNNTRSAHLVDTGTEIQVTPMDVFCNAENISKIDILLIDIEGMEEAFLEGASQSIRTFKPRLIVCEIWNDNKRRQENIQTTQDDIIGKFRNMGYIVVSNHDDDFVFEYTERR